MLTFVLTFLGAALAYDVYYFGVKKRRKSPSAPSRQASEVTSDESTDQASWSSKASSPAASEEETDALSWNVHEALSSFRNNEQTRVSTVTTEGRWIGDPFLLAIEEDRDLPLREIRRLLREESAQEPAAKVVKVDPYPNLIRSMVLEATLISDSSRFVLVSGLVLGVDDHVPGTKDLFVKAILPNQVVFQAGENTYLKQISPIEIVKGNKAPWADDNLNGTKKSGSSAEPPRQGEEK